jgi:hypothetical protein
MGFIYPIYRLLNDKLKFEAGEKIFNFLNPL